MATFEDKVIKIYNETAHTFPIFEKVIEEIFDQNPKQFLKETARLPEEEKISRLMRIYDILLHDYKYPALNDRFFPWLSRQEFSEFSAEEKERIQAEAGSHLDFYEVLQVMPGKGFEAASLVTGHSYFVSDISASRTLIQWDICMCRCYSLNGKNYATGTMTRFSPRDKPFIQEMMSALRQKTAKQLQEASHAEFCKTFWPIFFQIEREIHEGRTHLKIHTPYGAMQLCTLFFKVKDIHSILSKVEEKIEFSDIEASEKPDRQNKMKKMNRYVFSLLEKGSLEELLRPLRNPRFNRELDSPGQDGKSGVRSLGLVTLDPYIMRVEVQSAELADFFHGWLEKTFGSALQFKRIEIKDMAKLMAAAQSENPEAEKKEEIPAEIKQQLISRYMDDYYSRIIDQPIPMLKNHTPRQAARKTKLRPLLEQWLRELENSEERRKKMDGVGYPVAKIRQQLGM
ncbi:MAG TPA: hypothetical protein PLN61_08465 [bacterium]|nr:hypothetical protein [bacterium]HQI48687.1 hypothetical protein [bacterium]HQJ65004.1 hypothetical protein [bacterium]